MSNVLRWPQHYRAPGAPVGRLVLKCDSQGVITDEHGNRYTAGQSRRLIESMACDCIDHNMARLAFECRYNVQDYRRAVA